VEASSGLIAARKDVATRPAFHFLRQIERGTSSEIPVHGIESSPRVALVGAS
jgi:hypothetical protein